MAAATARQKGRQSDENDSLSEILQNLLDRYSLEDVTQYISVCSRHLSAVQRCNEQLFSQTAVQQNPSLVQQALDAVGQYYGFLGGLDEEVRRFLMLMGGVSGAEVDALKQVEPQVGLEISLLAKVAPAIQAVRPQSYIMPIDPISNHLAELKTASLNQVVVSRRRQLPVSTAVNIDCPNHMKIDGGIQLTNYDKSIINGVVSILESGNSSFTVPMLYHAMTGKENPTVDDGLMEEIKQKLDTMRKLSINIDLTAEMQAKMIDQRVLEENDLESFTIDGYLLPLNKYTGVVNGKRSELYQIIATPPLHSYAKLKNQISSVSIDLLRAPLNNNATTIPLKTYLLERIEAMKNRHNCIIRSNIRFDSIYRELGDSGSDKKRKKRIRDYTEIVLGHFIACKYIRRYEIVKEGRCITSVRVFWEEEDAFPPQQQRLALAPVQTEGAQPVNACG